MKKDTLRAIIALAVVLVLYVLVAFLIPFAHTAVFWISFVFTLIALAVVAATVYLALVKNPDAKSRFYGFPIAKIGVIYGAFQLAAGLLFMALGRWIPGWVSILVYALALGAALIGLISAEVVVEEIRTQDVQLKKDVSLMRRLQSQVSQMASRCDISAVKSLAEDFRYSDPVSSESIADVEADLASAVDELQALFIEGDPTAIGQQCRKTAALLAERNRLCKLNKG